MNSNIWFHYTALLFSLLLTIGVGMYAWRHRLMPGIKYFALLMLAEASWVAGFFLELISPKLGSKIFWDDFQFIGSMFVPLLLLIFAFEYTGQQRSLSLLMRIGLFVFPIVFLILLFTNPLHNLIRTSARIVPGKPFDALLYEFTLPMWVSFSYSYGTYIIAIVLFFRNLIRQQRLFRMQTLIIVLGFTFPFLGSIPGMAGILILGQRDIASYTFGIGNLIFAWGLFRYGLFGIVPIARDAVMEYMNDIMLVIDTELRIVDTNPAALSILDLPAQQVIGLPISLIFENHPDLADMLNQEMPVSKDVLYHTQKGQKYILDCFVSPLRNQNNHMIGQLLVARDITEQRQMEIELRKSYEELELRVQLRTAELEQANAELEAKNAELERFTYTVSHDLKSPLVTIGGFLGYLEVDARSGDFEKLQQDILRINNAANKMKSLLDELLELSRIGRMMNPSEDIPFEEIVREALDNVEGRLTGSRIEFRVRSALPIVHGDRARLVEVMQNLLDNAAKFTREKTNPFIEVGCCQEGENQIFFVKDNGIGIEPQYHKKIFELFDKLDPSSEGTGIGLAIVKRIIEHHRGKIWVESEVGEGSTFYFTLPVSPHQK